MLYTVATEEVRARLQELVADFWTPDEITRALNEGVQRFAQEEKWPYLFTVRTGITLPAHTKTLELESGVSFERHFNLILVFGGDDRPRSPARVSPAEGYNLRLVYYVDAAEPIAYYVASQAREGADEAQTITNGGSTAGTFTITFDSQTTGVIARGASAATVEAALKALSNVGPADVRVTGGPLGTDTLTIHFQGDLSGADVPEITLGGTTTSMTVATIVPGAAPTGEYVSTIRFVPALTRDADIEYMFVRDPDLTGSHLDIPEEYAMAAVAYATGHCFLKELAYSQKADEQFALYRKVVDDAKRESRKLAPDMNGFAWGKNQPEYMTTDAEWAWNTPLGP